MFQVFVLSFLKRARLSLESCCEKSLQSYVVCVRVILTKASVFVAVRRVAAMQSLPRRSFDTVIMTIFRKSNYFFRAEKFSITILRLVKQFRQIWAVILGLLRNWLQLEYSPVWILVTPENTRMLRCCLREEVTQRSMLIKRSLAWRQPDVVRM